MQTLELPKRYNNRVQASDIIAKYSSRMVYVDWRELTLYIHHPAVSLIDTSTGNLLADTTSKGNVFLSAYPLFRKPRHFTA